MSSTTSSTSDAQQTSANGQTPFQGSTPPLLPAFLITGLLLAAIVFIIVWRHLIERRNARREGDDPTWPEEGIGASSTGPKGPAPKLWELQFASESARATWAEIMPLSAAPLRTPPAPRRPRYLVPSDRPISFLTRMFGGERRESLPSGPPISVLAPTLARPLSVSSLEKEEEEEDPIDRLQVTVLISFPHRRRPRRASYLPDAKRISEVPSLPSEKCGAALENISEEPQDGVHRPTSPYKGKTRSLDTPLSVAKSYYEDEDEEGPMEVAFGTAILPFVEGEYEVKTS